MCFWGLFLQAPASIVRKNNCSIECCLLHTKHMMQKQTGRYAARKYHSMNPDTEVKTHVLQDLLCKPVELLWHYWFCFELEGGFIHTSNANKSFSLFSKELVKIDLSLQQNNILY